MKYTAGLEKDEVGEKKNNVKVELWSGVKNVVLYSPLLSTCWSTLKLSYCLEYIHVYYKFTLVFLHMYTCKSFTQWVGQEVLWSHGRAPNYFQGKDFVPF